MQGHEEDGGVVLKDVLCSIAVMNIPVQDEDAGCTSCLGRFGSNASVVEEAEAHGSAALSMMARRPNNGSTICRLTPANRQHEQVEQPLASLSGNCHGICMQAHRHCQP